MHELAMDELEQVTGGYTIRDPNDIERFKEEYDRDNPQYDMPPQG